MADDLVLDSPKNASDVLDLLNKNLDGDDKKVASKENKDDDNTNDTEDDEDKDTLKLEDASDDDESLDDDKDEADDKTDEDLTFDSVPKRQDILKKYPNFFKEFKGVEKALYREQQYAEVYPSIKDAQSSQVALRNYQQLEGQLVSGDVSNLFANLKANVPEAFDKIGDNLLETLNKVDSKAYDKTISKVIKGTLVNAYQHGAENDDEQLKIAAQLLHKAIYGSTKITPSSSNGDGKLNADGDKSQSDEQRKFNQERQQFFQTQMMTHVSDVGERASNITRNTIEKNIDPKNAMTDYVKDKAIQDTMTAVNKAIDSDGRLRAHLDRLWREAATNNFSEAAKQKVRNVLLAKVKSVLPSLINSTRNAALKGYASRQRDSNDDNDESLVAKGNSSRGGKKIGDGPKLDKSSLKDTRGMSTKDILDKLHG